MTRHVEASDWPVLDEPDTKLITTILLVWPPSSSSPTLHHILPTPHSKLSLHQTNTLSGELHSKMTAMASIAASSAASMLACNPVLSASPASRALGLPKMARVGKVRCSMEEKRSEQAKAANPSVVAINASLAVAAAAVWSPAAVALVDERMSTEGTGLPFGLSNNLLGWILLGVFALIWSFYTVYTSSLDEDEESGMSL